MIIKLFYDDVNEYIDDFKEDIIETLKEDGIEATEDAIYEEAQHNIDWALEDFKNGLRFFDNITDYDSILIEATLGLWNRTVTGKATANKLYDAVFAYVEDYNLFYFKDKRSTLTLKATHHDGDNYFKFYKVKNGKKYAITVKEMEATF